MRKLGRGLSAIAAAAGLAALMAGCVGQPTTLGGGMGAPSFAQLQQMCSGPTPDYGADAQPVYSTLLDAYVATRHGKLSKDDFCGFQTSIAQQYSTLGASADTQARTQWAAFFIDQRAKALSWRASADPTLRGG